MEARISTRLDSKQEARKFGWLVGVAFGVLGGVLFWRDHFLAAKISGGIGGLLILGAIVAPGKMIPVYRAWMAMAHQISRVTTPLVMGIVYFLIVTPIGVVMRAIKGNPMVHKRGDDGYWFQRSAETQTSDMRRQF